MNIIYICLIVIFVIAILFIGVHQNYQTYLKIQNINKQNLKEIEVEKQELEKQKQNCLELSQKATQDKHQAEILYKQVNDIYKQASELRFQHEEKQQKINTQIAKLTEQKIKLLSDIEVEKTKLKSNYDQEKSKIDQDLKEYKENYYTACEQYGDSLEKAYIEAENNYRQKIQQLKQEHQEAEAAVEELTNLLTAGRAAKLREKDLDLYKLQISNRNLKDVQMLEDIKMKLSQPIVLSKLIWSTYFQKQTTELCNRIFGTSTVCGIYKITHLQSQQVYIGQSVDCASRIKSHIKCGLGIDAPVTNKLYNFMQKEGVWNFSFELLEKCSKDKLDEKERFWINTYQSNIIGLNTKAGNK